MDLSELERLVHIVQNADISDLTLRQGDARIILRKAVNYPGRGVGTDLIPGYSSEGGAGDFNTDALEILESAFEESEQEPEEQTVWVTAPLVGIFHHIKPVVGLGARVARGQVVGVIEAMKLVTEVTAPEAGVVMDTLIEDGLPVEYGQHLFALQPLRDVSIPAPD